MTPYKIWRGKKPNLKHLHEFGSTCFVLNDREHGSKFDLKSDEGMLLRYSRNNRDYKVLNKRSKTIMESINVALDDQGITSIELRKDDAETEGPQFAPGDMTQPMTQHLTVDPTLSQKMPHLLVNHLLSPRTLLQD